MGPQYEPEGHFINFDPPITHPAVGMHACMLHAKHDADDATCYMLCMHEIEKEVMCHVIIYDLLADIWHQTLG